MSKLKISVVTVCFNAGKTIAETIFSVINQTYNNIEYIIIDGNSKDNTLEIVKSHCERLKWISEPDNGIYDAMNKALKIATGDYLIFLGADDHFISYDILEKVVGRIENTNDEEAVYYGDIYRPYRNDVYCHQYDRYKLAVKNISHQGLFYPRRVYKHNFYNLKYKVFADYAYNLNLYCKIPFVYLGFTVSYFNDNATSSQVMDDAFEKDYTRLRISCLGLLPYCYSAIYHFLHNLITKG